MTDPYGELLHRKGVQDRRGCRGPGVYRLFLRDIIRRMVEASLSHAPNFLDGKARFEATHSFIIAVVQLNALTSTTILMKQMKNIHTISGLRSSTV